MNLLKFLIMSALFSTFALAGVVGPNGENRYTNSSDFFWHKSRAKGYNENWSYQFVFDNGTTAWVNFNLAKIPSKGIKSGVDLTMNNFKGRKKVSVAREYPEERLTQNTATHTLEMKSGQSHFYMKGIPKKGHQVLFSTDKDGGYYVDLKFVNAIPGRVPGNAQWKVNGEDEDASYFHAIHIPYGQVEGRIAVGKDTITVKGYGYFDHIQSSRMSTETTEQALLFSSPNAKIAGRINTATRDYGRGAFGYAISFDGSKPKVLRIQSADFSKGNLKVEFDDFSTYNLKHNSHRVCYSPLDNIDGSLAKWAAKKMLGGKVILCGGKGSAETGAINYLHFSVED